MNTARRSTVLEDLGVILGYLHAVLTTFILSTELRPLWWLPAAASALFFAPGILRMKRPAGCWSSS